MLECRKFTMDTLCRFLVGGLRFLLGLKQAEIDCLSIGDYERSPSVAIFSFVNTLNSTSVVPTKQLVMLILSVTRRPNILPAVIRTVVVAMINLLVGPMAGHHQVRQSVGHVWHPTDADGNVAVRPKSACYLPWFSARRAQHAPPKMAGIWIVIQKHMGLFGGNILIHGQPFMGVDHAA